MRQFTFLFTQWCFVRPLSFIYISVITSRMLWLKWWYRGVHNIPLDKIPAAPIRDEDVKKQLENLLCLTEDYNYLCRRLNIATGSTQFGLALGKLVAGNLHDVNAYEGLHRIIASPTRRRDMIVTMVALGDLTDRRMDYICDTDVEFILWLNN